MVDTSRGGGQRDSQASMAVMHVHFEHRQIFIVALNTPSLPIPTGDFENAFVQQITTQALSNCWIKTMTGLWRIRRADVRATGNMELHLCSK